MAFVEFLDKSEDEEGPPGGPPPSPLMGLPPGKEAAVLQLLQELQAELNTRVLGGLSVSPEGATGTPDNGSPRCSKRAVHNKSEDVCFCSTKEEALPLLSLELSLQSVSVNADAAACFSSAAVLRAAVGANDWCSNSCCTNRKSNGSNNNNCFCSCNSCVADSSNFTPATPPAAPDENRYVAQCVTKAEAEATAVATVEEAATVAEKQETAQAARTEQAIPSTAAATPNATAATFPAAAAAAGRAAAAATGITAPKAVNKPPSAEPASAAKAAAKSPYEGTATAEAAAPAKEAAVVTQLMAESAATATTAPGEGTAARTTEADAAAEERVVAGDAATAGAAAKTGSAAAAERAAEAAAECWEYACSAEEEGAIVWPYVPSGQQRVWGASRQRFAAAAEH